MSRTGMGGARAGVILVAVLVVVAVGALIGTTLLYGAAAGRESGASSVRSQQSRMAAWSGVQAVMAELASQREELLRGASPRVTSAWRLGAAEGGGVAVYRVVAQGEELVVSEAARLDVNTAPAAVLSRAPGLDAEAERIVAERGVRPFLSVIEAVGDGPRRDGGAGEAGSSAEAVESMDVLTVFSFDPGVQAGIGARGSQARGKARIAVSGGLTEEIERDLTSRLDRRGVEVASALFRPGRTLGSMRAVVEALIGADVPAAEWGPVLDAIRPAGEGGEEEFLRGRVDLNRAPAEVLACLPGIDAAAAARIVEARGSLGADERADVAWPVVQGTLAPAAFAEAVDLLTTRTLQWRVVLEGGRLIEERGEAPAMRIGGGGDDVGDVPEDAVLADRVVLEAVIDVAGERPRVAYLRDVTWLPVAGVLAARRSAAETGGEDGRVAGMRSAEDDGADDGFEPVIVREAGRGLSARGGGAPAAAASPEAKRATGRIGRWVGGGGGAGGGR